jgi:hypothetical protein
MDSGNSRVQTKNPRPGNSQWVVSQAVLTPINRVPAATPVINSSEFST